MPLALRIATAIADIPERAWNALLDERATPFLDHRWLEALEATGCAGPEHDWSPRHLTLWDGARLVAAAPAYLRGDSDGDFSRDWDLAQSAMRAGIGYYPKLSLTVPFTPATGRRFLVAAGEDRAACVGALVAGARAVAEAERAGAVQVLFPDAGEVAELGALGMAVRLSHQYHWINHGYREPADFLARLDSKRRNQQRRERAAPAAQGIAIRTVRGGELAADPRGWARTAHALHRSTIEKLAWGRGWLNLAFYERVMARMPEHLEVVVAERAGRVVAGAFNVASPTHLYGRYWGCVEDHPFLHFNVCLYHSMDECIRRGVQVFEGGAGGEHKLARGFEPAPTWSAHLFSDRRFDAAVRRHLAAESARFEEALARFRDQSSVLRAEPTQAKKS